MENQNQIPSGDAMNNTNDSENGKDVKPVGYGSSIQSSGTGHRNRPIDKDKLAEEQLNKDNQAKEEASELGHS